jgi:hypothetical protein
MFAASSLAFNLVSAKLELVPATMAADVGFDRD